MFSRIIVVLQVENCAYSCFVISLKDEYVDYYKLIKFNTLHYKIGYVSSICNRFPIDQLLIIVGAGANTTCHSRHSYDSRKQLISILSTYSGHKCNGSTLAI